MTVSKSPLPTVVIAGLPVGQVVSFGWRVVRAFFRNKGLLLASAVRG